LLFGHSDGSSCICLNYKLVGQPFTKRQKSRICSVSIKLSLVDHTNIAQKQVIACSYLVV